MWGYNHLDELYHFGVKGMKWGVRRYQNKDGSLTPAGKKRMKVITEAADKAEQFSKYANQSSKRYKDYGDKISNPKLKKKKEIHKELFGNDNNDDVKKTFGDSATNIIKKQANLAYTYADDYAKLGKLYMEKANIYRSMSINTINRQAVKEAKNFVKNNKYFNGINDFEYSTYEEVVKNKNL